MTDDWASIWRRRAAPPDTVLGLAELLVLDGYDSGAARAVGVDQFRAYTRTMAGMLDLRDGDGVFEVGCGAGAFLYALREQVAIAIAGCDRAPSLITAARQALPDGDFAPVPADELATTPVFDVVVANGVFHYFPDLAYAEDVLSRMIEKSRRAVAVLEVPDEAHRVTAESLRRDSLPPGVYERRYAGLRHLYFSRGWFEAIARRHELEAVTFRHPMPDYPQGELRFGAILTRRRGPT